MTQRAASSLAVDPSDEHDYRPALDGIRAIAVLAVFGYHLGYRWLGGGFLGVDVFFVLSGYLITGLLLTEHQRTGRISLTRFWLRRARRLLPALFLMVVVVALWLHSNAAAFELPLRRRDLLWTLFYGANWHFIASGQDYFSQFTSASPLRHTWSLAVEEQFYFVWPLIVLVALAAGATRRWRVGIICGAGIVASVTAMVLLYDPGDPSRAYYGTDTRIHQPLIGALLAVFLSQRPSRLSKSAVSSVAAAGAATALLSGFVLLGDSSAAYYKGLSLGISFCAAVLIWGVETAPAGVFARLLGLSPVRSVGQISYGLYLWHWPAILAIRSGPPLFLALPGSLGINLTRVLITFSTAAASWSLIEQPIRRSRTRLAGSPQRFGAAAALSAALLTTIVFWATAPVATVDVPTLIAGCPGSTDVPCLRRRGSDGMPVVVLMGDSVARSLDGAFLSLAREHDWTYVLAARNGCRLSRLLTAYQGHVRPMDRACYDATPHLIGGVLATWNPTAVVAVDRWEIIDFVGPDGGVLATGTPEHIAVTETALADVARSITSKGARLAFLELPPVIPRDCLNKDKEQELHCQVPVANDVLQIPYNNVFRSVATRVPHVSTISMTDAVCPNGVCTPELDGILMRYDGLHFSAAGSGLLAPLLYRRLVHAGVVPRSARRVDP
jgi:peptidoglycan/LPS O-acetylase OafA/YrhL